MTACAAVANALGVDISIADRCRAPDDEWKGRGIGTYAVASGRLHGAGLMPPILGGPAVTDLLTNAPRLWWAASSRSNRPLQGG